MDLMVMMISFLVTCTNVDLTSGVQCISCFSQDGEIPYFHPTTAHPSASNTSSPFLHSTIPPTVEATSTPAPPFIDPLPHLYPPNEVPLCGRWENAERPRTRTKMSKNQSALVANATTFSESQNNTSPYIENCPRGCKIEAYKVILTSRTYGTSFSTLRLFRRCRDDFPRGLRCVDFSDVAKHNWIQGRDRMFLDESKTTVDFFSAMVCGCGTDFCNENATRVLDKISEQVTDWERSLHEDDNGGGLGDNGDEFVRGSGSPLTKVEMTLFFWLLFLRSILFAIKF